MESDFGKKLADNNGSPPFSAAVKDVAGQD